jgi:hypothetical protein
MNPEIHIRGEQVEVRHGKQQLATARLDQVIDAIDNAADGTAAFDVWPLGARIVATRRSAVAMALELAPHSRRVRWLSDQSKKPFGKGAKYDDYFVSFPYVVLLLVFKGGSLTGEQQLYYRSESLDHGEELLLPNLYNVAEGYGQRCWVCLQHAPDVTPLSWSEKIRVIGEHVFSAAFNRSSEEHEGNSYWSAHEAVDPRVESMEKWQAETIANRRVALDIAWRPAGTTASEELRSMLDRVVRPRSLSTATEFAGVVSTASRVAQRSAE